MKRILVMESGSHTTVGGAIKAAYQLYSGLKGMGGCKVDVFGDFSSVDKSLSPVSVEQMLGSSYSMIFLNSIRDAILADKYMSTHARTKAVYIDRSNTLLNYKTKDIGGSLADLTTALLSTSPVEQLISQRILNLSFRMWKKHMKKKESVSSALSSFAITTGEVVKRYLVTRMKRWLSCYVAITGEQEAYAKNFFGRKTKVVYIPIAPDKIYRKLKTKRTFNGAIYVGRLEERQKRIRFMIHGIDRIVDGHSESLRNKRLLKIVGDGPDEDEYRELVEQLRLDKNITFVGPAYGEELVREYNNAGFFVSTSEWESPGRTFLEAMACGLPVLNNTKNNIGIVKRRYNGMVYRHNNLESFAENFYFLYTNKSYREHLANNALKSTKQFSLEKTQKLYRKLVEKL